MASGRLPSRILLFAKVVKQLVCRGNREKTNYPQRVLIAHHLLLGDTIMLTPLIAKIRQQYPQAEIVMATPRPFCALYQKKPYGVQAIPYNPKQIGSLKNLINLSGFDIALIPGDNRYSWLAYALDSKWITAFAADRPAYKSWLIDQLVTYSEKPSNWADMNTLLIDGKSPQQFNPADWPPPDFNVFKLPNKPYAILHVGASSPLKMWPSSSWLTTAEYLTNKGYEVVWSAGAKEIALVSKIDPNNQYTSYAGQLDLPQLWHLISKAAMLICPDTGVAHIGKVTNTPTIAIFGPGSKELYGAGEFWKNSPYQTIDIENFHCRDQKLLFKREISWVNRCSRNQQQCQSAECMKSISAEKIKNAIDNCIGTKTALKN